MDEDGKSKFGIERVEVLKYFCINHRVQRLAYPYSAEVNVGRQNLNRRQMLTFKVDPPTVGVNGSINVTIRGLVKLKQIQKSEKTRIGRTTPTHPLSIFF